MFLNKNKRGKVGYIEHKLNPRNYAPGCVYSQTRARGPLPSYYALEAGALRCSQWAVGGLPI